MTFFAPENATRTPDTRRIYAFYELLHTLVEFAAAVSFLIGSIMFLWPQWVFPGTWMFIIGSVFFAAKPTVRILRELKLLAEGDIDDIASFEKK